MKIEYGVNPNCSEATMRILLDDQQPGKVAMLIDRLNRELYGDGYNTSRPDGWDDSEHEKEYNFSEASHNVENIFGKNVLTIKGDAPYNMGDQLTELVNKYLTDPQIEWGE